MTVVSSTSALTQATLGQHVVFQDQKLAKKFSCEPIPISTLYEAYFDGLLDIPGDLVEFLNQRSSFVKHTITRQHLQWAFTNFVPDVVSHSKDSDAKSTRELFDDRGEAFYQAFLGERLAFTCGRYRTAADDVSAGVDHANRHIFEKLELSDATRVLEVGCGFGSFLEQAAVERGVSGIGTTLSREQARSANRRFHDRGVAERVSAQLLDYRELPAERFDRIVALEVVERIGLKNLKSFFERLQDCLADDGLLLLQWTGLRRQLRPEDLMWGLFMNKHVFPGADSALPFSSMLKVAEKAGWEVQSVENISRHYVRTLQLWRRNWEGARAATVQQFGERWYRIWDFFLAWSEVVGAQGSAATYQVVLGKNLDHVPRRLSL